VAAAGLSGWAGSADPENLQERVRAFLSDLRLFEQYLRDADLGRALERVVEAHGDLSVLREECGQYRVESLARGRGGYLVRAVCGDLQTALWELLGRPRAAKRCYRCRQVKPLNHFSRRQGEPGGNIYCLVCERRRVKAYTLRKRAGQTQAAAEKAAAEKAAAKAGRARTS
jgi:hypothetical protein